MEIRVNNEDIGIEQREGDTVGDILTRADGLLEAAGAVIVGVSLDGMPLDPDSLLELGARSAAKASRLDIAAEHSSDYRARAIDLLLDIVAKALPLPDVAARRALHDSLASLEEGLGGLFPSDELAFIKSLVEALKSSDESEADRRFAESLAGFEAIFRERLAELRDPVAEFRRAATVYRGAAEELRELPVWLQTGKEGRAMQAVLVFVELFNKIIRLMPELGRKGVDAGNLRVGELELPAFYTAFNGVLKELVQAIEDRDSVLIGDLSEYEVAPRMEGLFAAIGEAIPA
ncbi:MAG TPA: hypothetical protein VMV44_02115 [Rectinemataceae bacterium]|nr:hypothetical protein [Rectinemataceae bacterium]